MRKLFLFLSILFYQFLVFGNLHAAKKVVEPSFFDAELFSLAKKTESAFDSASSVYVLSSQDIRRSGVTSIPEALRLVPGVQVARIHGNAWAISARGLNHQFASKLLVLMDGLTIYSPIFSGAFWDNHDYVMEDIDRIEVIRGPGGAIWGANAVNGIINIITKSSAETQGGYVSQIAGNYDNSVTEARYGGKTEDLDTYRIYAKHAARGPLDRLNDGSSNVDGTTNNVSGSNNDGMFSSRAGVRFDITSIENNSIKLKADFFRTESGNYFQTTDTSQIGGINASNGEPNHKENTGGNIVVNWDRTISKKSRTALQSYVYYDRNDANIVDYKNTIIDVDFQHFYDFSDRNNFVWGLGYRHMIDKIDSRTAISPDIYQVGNAAYTPLEYAPDDRSIGVVSAFIQDEYAIIPNDLFVTIGSKFQHNEQTGFEYQPSLRLKYFPDRNQTLWASITRAIRTPTRGEDDITIRVANGVDVARGSRGSESEEVLSYELGYRIKPNNKTSADLSLYYNEYDNLGNFDADLNNPIAAGAFVPTASNTGRAKTYGFEFTGKWQASNDLRVELGYDFLNADLELDPASNENNDVVSAYNSDRLVFFENNSPKHQLRLRAFYDITSKIEFDNMLYYVDHLDGRSIGAGGVGSGVNAVQENDVPSYLRWDVRLGYLATSNIDFSFSVQNILDDRHTEFTPGLFNNRVEVGRTYYGKMAIKF